MPPVMFALNHIIAPRRPAEAFFALARDLGIDAVELRNDLPETALLDGTSPQAVRTVAQNYGVRILSINALQRFNDWNPKRADEAKALIGSAVACGAEGVVLCPVNDASRRRTDADHRADLERALDGLAPLLREAGVSGLVEPLGFAECSLRLKAVAAEAILAMADAETFRLVHDTFHHFVSGEAAFFPDMTGLVHISGVADPSASAGTMRDPHRVLVDATDRIGNFNQIRTLLAGGYRGAFSFEPFSPTVTALPEIESAIRRSMQAIRTALMTHGDAER